ncbi:MAG: ion transporter [Gemmatimonadales bacterium]|nr:MAG: ion transporter [Gemmatimonadales bacterium]
MSGAAAQAIPPPVPLIPERSTFRTAWDLVIVLAVVVTGLVVPFQIVFVREVDLGGSLLVYLLDVLFVADIFLNFRTTFRAGGSEVTESAAVVRRYRRSGFSADLLGVVPLDALFLMSSAAVAGVPVVLLLRTTRLLRLQRLLRAFRQWERLHSTNTGYLRISKLVIGVFLLIHWIACGWFLVAVVEGFPRDSWTVAAGIDGLDRGSQYLRSLYWGFVTTTTVGFGDIVPTRNAEYAFTILVMVLGASMYALIIGSIASLVSSIDAAKTAFWDRADGVSQYLRSRALPEPLQRQIRDYYEYIWERYRGSSTQQFLRDLPDPIRLEVVFHLTRELIEKVPLFRHAEPALRNALLMSLQPLVFVPGSFVVREGEVATGVYFVSSGKLTITMEGGARHLGGLEAGDYFGDLSLLLGERRTGSVQATTHSDVFFLSTGDFERLRGDYPEFRGVLKEVASTKSAKLEELVSAGCIL